MIDDLHFWTEDRIIAVDDLVEWYIDNMLEQNPDFEYNDHSYFKDNKTRLGAEYQKTYVRVRFEHDPDV